MSRILRFDHVGVTVRDLERVAAFFVGLGLEIEGRACVEGEFIDTVIGIPHARTEIVMLRTPNGGTAVELSSFVRPSPEAGSPAAMATELGMRSLSFEIDDLQAHVDRLAGEGYGLVGGIGQYEGVWRMAYVRGPEGIIVALAERIGAHKHIPGPDESAVPELEADQTIAPRPEEEIADALRASPDGKDHSIGPIG
jgi:catechol 2,3-dioxygenase-like lactoylglutathione lyase family enzyme